MPDIGPLMEHQHIAALDGGLPKWLQDDRYDASWAEWENNMNTLKEYPIVTSEQ